MYTRPGTGGGGFNDGSSYASSSHYSGLPPGHGLPHGLPVTLSAHSSISGANRVVDALASGTVKEQRLGRRQRSAQEDADIEAYYHRFVWPAHLEHVCVTAPSHR